MKNLEKPDVRNFVFRFVFMPCLKQKPVLLAVAAALLVMASAQAMALLLSKGFLTAFFLDPNSQVINLREFIPQKFMNSLPDFSDVTIPRQDVVFFIPLAIFLVGALKGLSSYVYNFGLSKIALKVAQNYREIVFDAVLRLPWLKSSVRSPGDWMTVIMADAMFIQTRLMDFVLAFIKDVILILSCLVTLSFIHLPAAIALLAVSPVIAWQMGRAGRKIAWFAEAFQRELGALAGLLLGMRERFRYMRAQRGESFEAEKFDARNQAYREMMTGSIFIRSVVAPGMEWFGFCLFAVFIYGWSRKLPLFDVAPDLVLQFFVALGLILKPVREIGEQMTRLGETIGGIRRSMVVVSAVEAASSEGSPSGHKILASPSAQDAIYIGNFSVGYGDLTVLKGSDLTVKFGSAIAIVGPSGSGKSSFLRLMCGLVPPVVWESNFPWTELRASSAMVSQTPFLFKDSLRGNLLYGISEGDRRQYDDAYLNRYLSVVNMDSVIDGLSNKLDSEFNPLDPNLSGGQIQRLVIARALLRQPRILLLDEATSAIDVASELDITTKLIYDVRESGRILLAVTHRLQWLSMYDQIWFVEAGNIVQRGTFDQLMALDRFRSFVSTEAPL